MYDSHGWVGRASRGVADQAALAAAGPTSSGKWSVASGQNEKSDASLATDH